MLTRLFNFLSLRAFAISQSRRLWFAGEVSLLLIIFYFREEIAELSFGPRFIALFSVALAAYLAANLIRFSLVTTYRRRHKLEVGDRDNFILGMDALVSLFTIVITGISVFPIFDIPFQEFLTGLSLFAVAIVWGFQPYITNFFDGLRLMFSNDFRIGDYVRVSDNSRGIITDITFRATRLRTDDGDVVFVPNTTILNSEVTNFSKLKYKRVVTEFTLPAPQKEPLENLELKLRTALMKELPDILNEEKMYLRIVSSAPSETSFAFEVSIDSYSFVNENAIKKCVFQTILTL